jgi:hypothetical protein
VLEAAFTGPITTGLALIAIVVGVDFCRVDYGLADHSVLRKTLYTASFLHVFRDKVPNGLIPVNPLGLTITSFRVEPPREFPQAAAEAGRRICSLGRRASRT